MKRSSKTETKKAAPNSLVDEPTHGMSAGIVASAVDEVKEESHWRETFQSRPYVDGDASFEDYAPAYVYGASWCRLNPERGFDESEAELETGWNTARGDSSLAWHKAKPAARDAWYRIDRP
jgi:hypothetical protein